jgi:AcrR family transcriptional regulator
MLRVYGGADAILCARSEGEPVSGARGVARTMADRGTGSAMGSREQSKQQRRDSIVRAARELMEQTGHTGFSMRALARRAGVSIATPYNLFGSKQAIMFAILEAELAGYGERLRRARADELDRFFRSVSLVRAMYAGAPAFHRAILVAIYSEGGPEFRSMFSGPIHAHWRAMVERCIGAGYLADAVEPNAFAVNLGQTFFSCILEWAYGQISLDELEARVQYGFALALLGMATPAAAERLRGRVLEAQARLWRLWTKAAEKARAGAAGCTAAHDASPAGRPRRRRSSRARTDA